MAAATRSARLSSLMPRTENHWRPAPPPSKGSKPSGASTAAIGKAARTASANGRRLSGDPPTPCSRMNNWRTSTPASGRNSSEPVDAMKLLRAGWGRGTAPLSQHCKMRGVGAGAPLSSLGCPCLLLAVPCRGPCLNAAAAATFPRCNANTDFRFWRHARQPESAAPRAQGAPPDDDSAGRSHRHRPVRGLRRGHCRSGSGRRPARLPGDWPDGLLHHDEPGRTGHLHAGVGLVLHLCITLRGPRLRLRAGLELLGQLGHGRRRGRGGRPTGHGLLAAGYAGLDLERGVFSAHLRAERLFGAQLRRSRILVRPDQGGGRAVLHCRRPGHAGGHHPRRRPGRAGELDHRRRALRGQRGHLGGRGDGGGLFLPGHRTGGRGRGRIRKPAPQRAARHQ
ncbi:hypothetical protein D3C71_1227220 [compost metagenome]